MLYFNTNTLAFGVTFQEARAQYPESSIPVGVSEFGDYVRYTLTEQPAHDSETQAVREVVPINSGGWTQQWEVYALEQSVIDQNATTRKQLLKQAIADRRYEAETAGIEVTGVTVSTDRQSQALITGAAVSAMLDTNYVCRWKTPNGFVELDSASVIALASAVRAHVQHCFDREQTLCDAVDDDTYTPDMLEIW